MRKWQDLAAPDDAGSWYDVNSMWPTIKGTYRNVDYHDSGTEATATSADPVLFAWCGSGLTANREYVVDTGQIWQYAAGAYTDRTGGVTIGTYPYMTQYGDVTICAMGNTTDTVYSTGGNFAALAGAPDCEIVVTQSNAVLAFNTGTSSDGWAASDVGDYTNWTTGEAASGRFLATPGPVTAAVPFGQDVIVFKAGSIYRMWYVGGIVKWATQLLVNGVGCQQSSPFATQEAKYMACAGMDTILFCSASTYAATDAYWYRFDGTGFPIRVNPLTTVAQGRTMYNPSLNMFTAVSAAVTDTVPSPDETTITINFYSATVDAWGKSKLTVALNSGLSLRPLMGAFSARSEASSMPTVYGKFSADNLKRWTTAGTTNLGSCNITTSMFGKTNSVTQFTRLIPILHSRSNTAAGTCTILGDTELHGGTATSDSATESSSRARYDFNLSKILARFKLAYGAGTAGAAGFIQIEDVIVDAKHAGKE